MDSMMLILGTLGAYFSILLVLSVAVETILGAIKTNGWLNKHASTHEWLAFLDVRKKHVSPDQAMRDIMFWVPPKSQAEAQIATINQMVKEFGIAMDEVTRAADSALDMTNDLIALTGLPRPAAQMQQKLARKLYVIRREYNEQEGVRITRLRMLSAFVGTFIAVLFQLNTFMFLAPLWGDPVNSFLTNPVLALAGMVLTGLATSAGSSFWHDQLERVRAIKESARTVQALASKYG